MTVSAMRTQFDRYLANEALFATHVERRALAWKVNYAVPLANAYGEARSALREAIRRGQALQGQADADARALQEQVATITGLVIGLLGPFSAAAATGLRSSLRVTSTDVYSRTLRGFYQQSGAVSPVSFDTLLDREVVRAMVLNYVTDRGVAAIENNSQIVSTARNLRDLARRASGGSSGDGDTATAPPPLQAGTVSLPATPLPQDLLSGEFDAARFQTSIETLFNRLQMDLRAGWERICSRRGSTDDDRRAYLDLATQSVLVRPPHRSLDEIAPAAILRNLMILVLISNHLLRVQRHSGLIWPSIRSRHVATQINLLLERSGGGFILNNPGVEWRRPSGHADPGVLWDGMMQPAHRRKILAIGESAIITLDTYMQSIADNETLV